MASTDLHDAMVNPLICHPLQFNASRLKRINHVVRCGFHWQDGL